ncbi:hypothetical protein [Roseinatronobacter sp.]|uniref:hypothetical protein n=1 Tax=Roseinatronobacter sp. TaxID=1945755 RepID=UPI0025EF67AA|nr:hypothetical protein [Rhodobaca sp.]
MSFFAGFVNGVFQGKNWREARDDRKRKREWEIEDREHAIAQRGRTVSGWAEEDEARARAEQERLDAEASQQRVDESLRRALGLTDDVAPANEGNQGMSVMDAVPQGTRATPPPSSQGLTVRGALGELG